MSFFSFSKYLVSTIFQYLLRLWFQASRLHCEQEHTLKIVNDLVYILCIGWLTICGNLPPWHWWVHKGSVLDLVINVLILVKRECAAETDINNHSYWPHVQGAVISFTAQHFRGQVCWRPNHRATKRFLTNNTSKTKVTQFYLPIKMFSINYVSSRFFTLLYHDVSEYNKKANHWFNKYDLTSPT